MNAVRKSLLFAAAALALLTGLSGCIVADRPGWHGDHRWHDNGWQGDGQGGGWSRHH
jgi:hypothetical protein